MKRAAAIALWFFLLGASLVRAGLTTSLTPSVQNSAQGRTLVFTATLTNSSATDALYLNDIQFALNSGAATLLKPDTNTYFSNVPGILLPGETYSGPLFSVALDATATPADYSGTVSVLGGADIFTNSSLSAVDFAVLFPAVTLVATDASASEFGPDNGTFTLTRTGRTDIDLIVTLSTSGSAVNGITYAALPAIITIPAGSASQTITLTPLPDNLAQGDRNAVLTVAPSVFYAPGINATDTIVVHDKPADAWRFQTFGASANDPQAADNASWLNNGMSNLMAYALNMDPKSNDRSGLPAVVLSGGYLTLSYVPNAGAIDLAYDVQASTDLLGWNTTDVEVVNDPNPNPPNRVTYRYKFPVSTSGAAFLRLHVTRAP